MKLRLLFLFLLTCCTQETTQFTHHVDGKQKPTVHLEIVKSKQPVNQFPWCLSEEFTDLIEEQLISNGALFIYSENHPHNDPAEFNAKITLLEHEIIEEKQENESISKYISIAFNVEVIDLRKSSPKVILKERVRDKFSIPSYLDFSYQNQDWKKGLFQFTPIGYAHKKIRQRIISDLEVYCCRAHTHQ